MRGQRFRGHVVACSRCSHQSKGETLIVAQAKDRDHAIECDAKAKKQASADAAAAAQGKLF